MQITVNGTSQQVAVGTTISRLLETLRLDPQRVAVERNLEVVAKDDFADTILADGDSLEIVQFVGGG